MKDQTSIYLQSILVGTSLLLFSACGSSEEDTGKVEGIRPWPGNPHYLAWGETPVFPLGPTVFHAWTPISRPEQLDYEAQLHRLAEVMSGIGSPHVVGFVRCLPYDPMNHLHDGEVTSVLQPWVRLEDGRFDLERFEPQWEERLKGFLELALRLRIVVSLEVWDDWSVTRGIDGDYDPGPDYGWNAHPFNPNNNITYGPEILPETTAACGAPFYNSIHSQGTDPVLLDLQKRYVDHLLGIISDYPHILVNIANESRATLEWSRFWAEYIREKGPRNLMIGDMPSTNRIDGGGECEHAFNPLTMSTDPRYDFVDIAQAVSAHEFRWDINRQTLEGSQRILAFRQAMEKAGTIRPLIISKDYTRRAPGGTMVFWSRFFGGAATARFHRPALTDTEAVVDFQHETVSHLGRFIAQVPFWHMHPDSGVVTSLPEGAGVNVLATPGSLYAIQLAGAEQGGKLSMKIVPGNWIVTWTDPVTGLELSKEEVVVKSDLLELDIPGERDHRALLVRKK